MLLNCVHCNLPILAVEDKSMVRTGQHFQYVDTTFDEIVCPPHADADAFHRPSAASVSRFVTGQASELRDAGFEARSAMAHNVDDFEDALAEVGEILHVIDVWGHEAIRLRDVERREADTRDVKVADLDFYEPEGLVGQITEAGCSVIFIDRSRDTVTFHGPRNRVTALLRDSWGMTRAEADHFVG